MIRQVICHAGIGDNIIALTSVCGLKAKYPGDHVIFSTNYPAWAELFKGYDELTNNPVKADINYRPYDSYKIELAEGLRRTRAEYYASFTDNVKPTLPGHHTFPPSPYPGCIVLVPFSAWKQRSWPIEHWHELARRLGKVVVLDDRQDRCQGFDAEKVLGQSPERVCSILKGASLVIANDSGMAHVAGALRTRTIAICAVNDGKQIFGVWPSVEVVQGGSLKNIKPEDVLRQISS